MQLSAILLASALKARRQREQEHAAAIAATQRAAASKIAGEYGFLRAEVDGYNLSTEKDPSGLLPTVFPDGTGRPVGHHVLGYGDVVTAHLRLKDRKGPLTRRVAE